jgi:hypothetical protein
MRMAIVVLLALACVVPVSAQRKDKFAEKDADGDGYITKSEWSGHMGNFKAMDCNKDDKLSRLEFDKGPHEHNSRNCVKE